MKFRCIALAILVLLSASATAVAKPAVPVWRDQHPWSSEVATVRVGDVALQAEIADTSALQTRGLGYRDGLAPGTAMIFIFPEPAPRSFWMKGMRFCLDIIWIRDGVITGAAENACPMPDLEDADLPRYRSDGDADMVLEVPAGWMAENNIDAGTNVEIILPGENPG